MSTPLEQATAAAHAALERWELAHKAALRDPETPKGFWVESSRLGQGLLDHTKRLAAVDYQVLTTPDGDMVLQQTLGESGARLLLDFAAELKAHTGEHDALALPCDLRRKVAAISAESSHRFGSEVRGEQGRGAAARETRETPAGRSRPGVEPSWGP